MKHIVLVGAVALFLVGCPPPVGNGTDHPVVGDWMIRWQINGEWGIYVPYHFDDDGTFAQVLTEGGEIRGTYTIISENHVQATYRIGIFPYNLDIHINGDSMTGTFQVIGVTSSPLQGIRMSKTLPVLEILPEQDQVLAVPYFVTEG